MTVKQLLNTTICGVDGITLFIKQNSNDVILFSDVVCSKFVHYADFVEQYGDHAIKNIDIRLMPDGDETILMEVELDTKGD